MTKDNNKNKQTKMTKIEIEALAKKLMEEMEKTGLEMDINLDEKSLNALTTKIISRMVKLKSMETWFDHVSKSNDAWSTAYKDLEMTEEENAIGEAAKLMTLMGIFQEAEEYEKCAIIRNRLDEIEELLKKRDK